VLANCAALNIGPNDAARLTLGEYDGLIFQHNLRHETEEKVEPPSDEWFDAALDEVRELAMHDPSWKAPT
jgi:hypothetical protein